MFIRLEPPIALSRQQFYDRCLTVPDTLKIADRVDTDSTIVSMIARRLGAEALPRLAAEPIPVDI